jgi:hypothetical protein
MRPSVPPVRSGGIETRAETRSSRYAGHRNPLIAAACSLGALAGATAAVAGIAVAAAGALCWTLAAIIGPLRGAAERTAPLPPGALRFAFLQSSSNVPALLVNRRGVLAVAAVAGSSVEASYAAVAIGGVLARVQPWHRLSPPRCRSSWRRAR